MPSAKDTFIEQFSRGIRGIRDARRYRDCCQDGRHARQVKVAVAWKHTRGELIFTMCPLFIRCLQRQPTAVPAARDDGARPVSSGIALDSHALPLLSFVLVHSPDFFHTFDDEGWQELLEPVKNISEGVDEQNALHLL